MGSIGGRLVLSDKTMARQRGVVGVGLGVRAEVREYHYPIYMFHIRTQTRGD